MPILAYTAAKRLNKFIYFALIICITYYIMLVIIPCVMIPVVEAGDGGGNGGVCNMLFKLLIYI